MVHRRPGSARTCLRKLTTTGTGRQVNGPNGMYVILRGVVGRRNGLNVLRYGVGVRGCELPIIYRRGMRAVDATVEEGMVICLEPETSVESRGETVVVKVEDMYQVTATGLERLSTAGYTQFWEE